LPVVSTKVSSQWRKAAGITLIGVYEREHYPVDFPNPIEAIKFRLEQKGKDTRALIGVVAGRTRVYEVMRGDRPLSLNMIRKLHSKLNIPAEVLIKATGSDKPRKHRPKSGRPGKSLRKSA